MQQPCPPGNTPVFIETCHCLCNSTSTTRIPYCWLLVCLFVCIFLFVTSRTVASWENYKDEPHVHLPLSPYFSFTSGKRGHFLRPLDNNNVIACEPAPAGRKGREGTGREWGGREGGRGGGGSREPAGYNVKTLNWLSLMAFMFLWILCLLYLGTFAHRLTWTLRKTIKP